MEAQARPRREGAGLRKRLRLMAPVGESGLSLAY
jgi:hypothetical protein